MVQKFGTGVKVENGKTVDNSTRTVATVTSCPIFKGKFFTGKAKIR